MKGVQSFIIDDILNNKKDVDDFQKKQIIKRKKKFAIRSGISRTFRHYDDKDKAHKKFDYRRSMKGHPMDAEREQRELSMLLRSSSEKMYRTTAKLVNISKKIAKKAKKNTLLRHIDIIDNTEKSDPYTKRRHQIDSSIKILTYIQNSESVFKNFVKVIVSVFRDFIELNYSYFLDNFMTNSTLRNIFKRSFAMDSDTRGVSFFASFLEHFLVALNIQIDEIEQELNQKTRRIQRLTGKLEDETAKNYEQILEAQIGELKKQIAVMDSDKADLYVLLEKKDLKNEALQRKYNVLSLDYDDLSRKIEEYQSQYKNDLDKISDLEDIIDQKEFMIKALKKQQQENLNQVSGIKLKAQKMSLNLKEFTKRIRELQKDNTELKYKLEKRGVKDNLGYESLTPRPLYHKMFKSAKYKLNGVDLGLKLTSHQLSTEEFVQTLMSRIEQYKEQILEMKKNQAEKEEAYKVRMRRRKQQRVRKALKNNENRKSANQSPRGSIQRERDGSKSGFSVAVEKASRNLKMSKMGSAGVNGLTADPKRFNGAYPSSQRNQPGRRRLGEGSQNVGTPSRSRKNVLKNARQGGKKFTFQTKSGRNLTNLSDYGGTEGVKSNNASISGDLSPLSRHFKNVEEGTINTILLAKNNSTVEPSFVKGLNNDMESIHAKIDNILQDQG